MRPKTARQTLDAAIVQGDAREVLRGYPDGHFQTCVTSPPYFGLRNYGVAGQIGLESSVEEYVTALVEVFREVRRALRTDGTLWLNLGDSYADSWGNYAPGGIKGKQRPQSENGKRWERPAYADTATLPPTARVAGLKPKDLIGVPWRVAFALQADGWWLRSDIIWSKPNPMPESVQDRPTRSHEYIFLLSKSARYFYNADAIRESLQPSSILRLSQDVNGQEGSRRAHAGGKTNGTMKAVYRSGNKERKLEIPTRPNDHRGSSVPWEDSGLGRNKRSVWTIATQAFPGAHFATFPEALVKPCILAGSRDGDVVLDPFAGSGTTGVVAQKAGRRAVLIDLSAEYVEMMRERFRQAVLL